MPDKDYDQIGIWSEIKLEIIKRYATGYTSILSKKPRITYGYIDAFSGRGVHVRKVTKEFVPGSPLNAMLVKPPFHDYHFIELNQKKLAALDEIAGEDPRVHTYNGDCNAILIERVFPKFRFENFRRGLCLLDPYGLQLNWEVIETAGKMGTIEIFLNFPTMDINRNVLRRDREKVSEFNASRMNQFWGDGSWVDMAYQKEPDLFGEVESKADTDLVVQAFRDRLKRKAVLNMSLSQFLWQPLKGRSFIICFLRLRNKQPLISRSIYSRKKINGVRPYGAVKNRVDGSDLEPGHRMFQDKPRLS